MRTIPERVAALPRAQGRILVPHDNFFSTDFLLRNAIQGAPTGAASWPSTSDPVAIPFAISEAITITHFGCRNGTTLNGNIDIGVYDRSFNRLVSTGSTALSGPSAWQWIDITDYGLPRGSYYLAASHDDTTTQNVLFYGAVGVALHALAGVKDSTTNAHPLPNPLTNMVDCAQFTRLPWIAIRTVDPYA